MPSKVNLGRKKKRASELPVILHIVLLLKSIHTSAGIDELLSAGIERMTFRANFNPDLRLGGGGFKSFAASALYRSFFVIGMYSVLHIVHLLKEF